MWAGSAGVFLVLHICVFWSLKVHCLFIFLRSNNHMKQNSNYLYLNQGPEIRTKKLLYRETNLIVWYINLLTFCGQNNFWYSVSYLLIDEYVCLSVRGQSQGRFFRSIYLYFETTLSLAWKSSGRLGLMASKPWESCCFQFLCDWITWIPYLVSVASGHQSHDLIRHVF